VMGCLLASVSVATTQSIVSLHATNASVSSSASNSLSTSNDDLVLFLLRQLTKIVLFIPFLKDNF
jgi:hypothetical protein